MWNPTTLVLLHIHLKHRFPVSFHTHTPALFPVNSIRIHFFFGLPCPLLHIRLRDVYLNRLTAHENHILTISQHLFAVISSATNAIPTQHNSSHLPSTYLLHTLRLRCTPTRLLRLLLLSNDQHQIIISQL